MKWLPIVLIGLLCISSAYALTLFPRPKDASGNLQPNTPFTYKFGFSRNDNCTDIFFNHTESVITDESGVAFVRIPTHNISDFPSVLCEYKDGSLRKIHNYSDLILRSLQVKTINVTNITAERGFFDYVGDAMRRVIQGFFVDIQSKKVNATNITAVSIQTDILNATNITAVFIQAEELNVTNITAIQINATNITVSGSIFGRFLGSVTRWWDDIWVRNATIERGNVTTELILREEFVNTTSELDARYFTQTQVDNDTIIRGRNTSWINKSVGNWSKDKSSYAPTTDINNWISDNVTDANTSMKSYVDTNYVPYTGADQNLALGANNFTVDTQVLYVDSTNNRVGIGTANPSQMLEVAGGDIKASAIQVGDGYSGGASLGFTNYPGTGFYVREDGGGNPEIGVAIDSVATYKFGEERIYIKDVLSSYFARLTFDGTEMTGERNFIIDLNNAARTIDLVGNPTLGNWFDQNVKIDANVTHHNLTLTGDLSVVGTGHDSFADFVADEHTDVSLLVQNNTEGDYKIYADTVNTTSLITTDINSNTSQDLKLWEDLTIDDAAAGQSLYIYRNAPEGSNYMQFYVAANKIPTLNSPTSWYFSTNNVVKIKVSSTSMVFYDDIRLLSDTIYAGFGAGTDARISFDGTNMIFLTDQVGDGIAYFTNNISTTKLIERTPSAKSYTGDYLSSLKSPNELLDASGKLKREDMFEGEAVSYQVSDPSSCVNITIYDKDVNEYINTIECKGTLTEEGISPSTIALDNRLLISEFKDCITNSKEFIELQECVK